MLFRHHIKSSCWFQFAVAFVRKRHAYTVPVDGNGKVQKYELTKCTQLVRSGYYVQWLLSSLKIYLFQHAYSL